MHRIRQLILAGTQPPGCFEPASKTISDEMATASALMLSYRVADWRGFLRFQRDLATRLPPWGEEHASAMHSIRAWGDLLAPNDQSVSGVPSAPIPGPVTIG